MPTGACFGRVFLRIVKGLRTTRLMPGASRLSAIVSGRDGRSGVTPKRAPIPMLIGRAFERWARFGQGTGWLAQKSSSCVRPGPRAVVKHFLRCIQVWLLPASRYGLAPYVFRRRVGGHSQPTKTRPMGKREKAPCLSSNRSTMGPMVDSKKIHAFDIAVELQSGRTTDNNRSRFRLKRALQLAPCAHNEEGFGDEKLPRDTLRPPTPASGRKCWWELDV